MLSSLRNQAGSLWSKILLAFLVLTFAVWGIEDMLRHRGSAAPVAEVGGEPITQQQLARSLERELEGMRRMLGNNFSPELARSLGLHGQVLNKMINSQLLVLEAHRLGIIPSDEAVAARIKRDVSFQEDGKFSKERFRALLRGANISEVAYAEDVRRSLGDDILTHAVESSAAPLVTQAAVETMYKLRNETRSITLLTFPLSSVPTPALPEESVLQDYHKAHAQNYSAPEYRTLSYILLNRDELSGKSEPSEEDLKTAYAEREAEFKRPEKRDVKQMLFSSKEAADKAQAELNAGKSFAEVAKAQGAQNAGNLSLGYVERSALPDTAQDTVFALKKGGVSPPIESPFGWHIFKVESVQPAKQLGFEEVRAQLTKDFKASHADDGLHEASTKIEDALAGGATLQEAVQPFGLKVYSVGPIDQSGKAPDGSKPANLPEFENFLKTAFRLEEKTDSTTTTGKGSVFFIVRAESVQPAHVRPFDEVKRKVAADWQKDARAAKLSELADAAAKKLASANDPLAAANTLGGQLETFSALKRFGGETEKKNPLPAAMLEEVFTLGKGKASQSYSLGDDRYGIAIVREVTPAKLPTDTKALDDLRHSLEQTMQSELLQQYLAALRERYGVTVNDAVFEQITAPEAQR